MFGNQWHKKEKPLPTMIGMGGGATGMANAGVVIDPAFAKLSDADADTKDGYVPTLSNNDLTASAAGGASNWHHGRTTLGFTTGKWYWEVTASGNAMIGIEPTSEDIDRQYFNEGTSAGLASRDGWLSFGGTDVVSGQTDWSDGDTIGVAFNANDGYIYFYINGSLSYSYDSTMSNSVFKKPAYSVYGGWTLTFNFGDAGFDETPPTGYQAVATQNGASES